ncbi:TIGR02391 family protein [Methanolobus sp. ZRKC2]|uniref:TIGR02391 family protein n=1 Tax=Methanolobus sp. ZRKC2 TaxID=3125783 RepID=UPI00324C4072
MSKKSKKKVKPRNQLFPEPTKEIRLNKCTTDVLTSLIPQCHILDSRFFGWMEKESEYDWGCKMVDYMTKADISKSIIYATLKTGRILSEENLKNLSEEEIEEWNLACDEYRELSESDPDLITTELNSLPKETECPDLSKEELEAVFELRGLHPLLVEKCKRTFVNSHFRESVMNGTLAVLQEIKEITGRIDLDGSDLVDNVFSPVNPVLSTGQYGLGDDTEQKGVHFLFKGFVLAIRNQFMHRDIYLENPFIAIEYLSFFTFLLRILDGMTLNESDQVKDNN